MKDNDRVQRNKQVFEQMNAHGKQNRTLSTLNRSLNKRIDTTKQK
jgi:hypothetical protein